MKPGQTPWSWSCSGAALQGETSRRAFVPWVLMCVLLSAGSCSLNLHLFIDKKKIPDKTSYNFQNPQKWPKTILMESSGLPIGPEGRAGVCLEATGPAQWLVVYNLQRNWFPSGKVVVSGKTPISHAFRTARCSSGTSQLTGQPDSSAGGIMGEGSGSAARSVLC